MLAISEDTVALESRTRAHGAYGDLLAGAFGMRDTRALITRVLNESTLAVTEIECQQNFGKTAPIPREDAYLLALQLRACRNHDLYLDGRRVQPTNCSAGVTSIYDLRRRLVWDLRDACHSLMFYLPRATLDAVVSETGAPSISDLRVEPSAGIDDPITRHLLSSLLPVMARPNEKRALFLDYVGLALTCHIAQAYGGINALRVSRGGLAPWQLRRAQEMMTASNEGVSLDRLASGCGLSTRHFARAFRNSTGVPPHRWLLKHRVERAKALLASRRLSLADVALTCGFADQSHFTRVFAATVGVSPGFWRRLNGAGPET